MKERDRKILTTTDRSLSLSCEYLRLVLGSRIDDPELPLIPAIFWVHIPGESASSEWTNLRRSECGVEARTGVEIVVQINNSTYWTIPPKTDNTKMQDKTAANCVKILLIINMYQNARKVWSILKDLPCRRLTDTNYIYCQLLPIDSKNSN